MIRINLLPSKKKAARASAAAAGGRSSRGAGGGGGAGQWWMVGMLLGWVLIGGAGYWLLSMEDQASAQMRQQAASKAKAAELLKQEIDEEGLEASKKELAMQEAIVKKVDTKRRSPVYVMYELGMILSEGQGPDVDKQKLFALRKTDPQAEPNKLWDPTGLWLTSLVEKGGVLAVEGGARDATDLFEFTRRLRASAWFGDVSHPNFERSGNPDADGEQFLTWRLEVSVLRWD